MELAVAQAAPPPGWSNSPPDNGISSTEPPPGERPMSDPGWSNDPVEAASIVATGATAGKPGTWTPDGATPPADFSQIGSIVATPTTGWLNNEGVVLGDGSDAHWDGTQWAVGVSQLPPA